MTMTKSELTALALSMRVRLPLRRLQPGQRFYLLRNMQQYVFLRRDHSTPSGTRYVVRQADEERESSLHPSCQVAPCEALLREMLEGKL